MSFSEDSLSSLQPFRAWLEATVGDHLLKVEVVTDEENTTYLYVEIDEEFKKARLADFQDSEQPNS